MTAYSGVILVSTSGMTLGRLRISVSLGSRFVVCLKGGSDQEASFLDSSTPDDTGRNSARLKAAVSGSVAGSRAIMGTRWREDPCGFRGPDRTFGHTPRVGLSRRPRALCRSCQCRSGFGFWFLAAPIMARMPTRMASGRLAQSEITSARPSTSGRTSTTSCAAHSAASGLEIGVFRGSSAMGGGFESPRSPHAFLRPIRNEGRHLPPRFPDVRFPAYCSPRTGLGR